MLSRTGQKLIVDLLGTAEKMVNDLMIQTVEDSRTKNYMDGHKGKRVRYWGQNEEDIKTLRSVYARIHTLKEDLSR